MVIRYATSIEDELDVSCLNVCCAPENVVEELKERYYSKCSAVYSELNWKIKLKRWFYQLWVNKCEQPLIDFTRKYNIRCTLD